MIRTTKDISVADEFKAELARILAEPVLVTALQVLARENMPSFRVAIAPGMDAMQSVALDYAQRCGAQALIERLQQLPYLTTKVMDKADALGKPWEWCLEDEVILAAQEQEKEESTGKKRITKPKSK
jgi:hypothetical protein